MGCKVFMRDKERFKFIQSLDKDNCFIKDTVEKKMHINEQVVDLLNSLYEENERLKNKLNVTALELVDEAISMGKAVEISEMNYQEFLEYRQKKGKPMELQR